MAITKNNLQDLTDLDDKLVINRALGLVLSGTGPRTQPSAAFANSFVRLTDRSILEHELAREELTSFIDYRSIQSFFRAQGHLETCIESMHRALNFAEALRRIGLKLPDGTALISRAKDSEILSSPVRKRIRDLRHAIQHVEERLINSGAPVGKPIALNPDNNGVSLEGVTITYDELARWLRELHKLAMYLNHYKEPAKQSP